MALINFMGISNALADTAQTAVSQSAPAAHGNSYFPFLLLILFILAFYFLLIRPQARRAKEQKQMLSNVAIGDEVMTAGGIVGRITRLRDNYVGMIIAKGVEITVQKGSIAGILPKGTVDFAD